MTCSYFVWDQDQIPCVHACAVIRMRNFSPYQYVDEFYHSHTLQATYTGKVMPIGDKYQWIPREEDEGEKIGPPNQERSAGRPKKERFPSLGEFKRKGSSNRCRRCGKSGHNKKASTNPSIVLSKPVVKKEFASKK